MTEAKGRRAGRLLTATAIAVILASCDDGGTTTASQVDVPTTLEAQPEEEQDVPSIEEVRATIEEAVAAAERDAAVEEMRQNVTVTLSCIEDAAGGTITNRNAFPVDVVLEVRFDLDDGTTQTGSDIISGLQTLETGEWGLGFIGAGYDTCSVVIDSVSES
jgi:hypothetical protein